MRRNGWRAIAIWIGAFSLIGLLEFSYHYLDVLARGHSEAI